MDRIKMTWPELRDFVDSHALQARLAWMLSGKRYRVWIEYEGLCLEAQFQQGHAFGVEFESDYKASITDRVGDEGMPSIAVRQVPPNATNFRKSWRYTALPNATTIFDERVDGMSGPRGITYLVGGRYKVRGSADDGSYLDFAVVDRDDVLGLFATYGLNRCKLGGLTSITGTFQVGDTVTGDTSGATAYVLAVGADYLEVRADYETFTASEGITADVSGAIATLSASPVTEGDVLEITKYVSLEYLEGDDKDDVEPGGSKKLVVGLYLRTLVYNAGAQFRLKVTLILARE